MVLDSLDRLIKEADESTLNSPGIKSDPILRGYHELRILARPSWRELYTPIVGFLRYQEKVKSPRMLERREALKQLVRERTGEEYTAPDDLIFDYKTDFLIPNLSLIGLGVGGVVLLMEYFF